MDITKDATANMAEYERVIPEKIDNYKIESPVSDFDTVAQMIEAAERPVIYAGGGIIAADAAPELKKFQALADAPVTLATMGLGGFPASDRPLPA